jgi:predicted metalloendopeptidase
MELNLKTKKNKTKKNKKTDNLKQQYFCKKYPNNFEGFEKKIDKLFKTKKIDITSTSYNLEKEIIKEIKKAVSPSNITPNNDFYSYVNERWLKDLDIDVYQKYITQIDDFRLVQDKVYRELIEIIEENINNKKNTNEGKIMKNAYESFKIYNNIEQSRNLSKNYGEHIEEMQKNELNIWKNIATVNKNEIISWSAPLVWSIKPDEKNPKKYISYLEPPQVTLLDIDIYYDNEYDNEEEKKYKKKYRNRYLKYLKELFIFSFGENHEYNINDIYNTEIELLNAMDCNKKKNNLEYNLISKEESKIKYKFDWEEFCKELGLKDIPNKFVTSNLNYLLCGTKLLIEKWNSKQWKSYWVYIYIKQQTRWSEKGFKIFYDFHGNFLRGQEKLVDDYIRPAFGMSYTFNTFLTNKYILYYKNQQTIDYVKILLDDLRIVFMRIIKRNKWLQEKTKKIAIEKLKTIKLIVGSPEILREDPLLEYKSDDPWGNLLKMSNWRHIESINLIGKEIIDIPMIDWSEIPPKFISTQAYIVNAMYTPTENSIYIPLGYIQKPFIDLEQRGLEYNLAHIGFTLSHEMSHALDDWGSKYDKEGKLNDWWTEKDKQHFKKIQEDIVYQYEKYASIDGIKLEAWSSIGEDLADISGFSICLEYLRDFQLKNQDILPIQVLSFKAFFTYFALQYRQKINKKAILAQLKTNPHPLDKYRCNVPLSRSNVFRAIYNVKKTNKMWWHSTNSVW